MYDEKKYKKSLLMPLILFVYTTVMAIYFLPRNTEVGVAEKWLTHRRVVCHHPAPLVRAPQERAAGGQTPPGAGGHETDGPGGTGAMRVRRVVAGWLLALLAVHAGAQSQRRGTGYLETLVTAAPEYAVGDTAAVCVRSITSVRCRSSTGVMWACTAEARAVR